MKRRRRLWIGLGAALLLGFFALALAQSQNRLDREVKAIAAEYRLTPIDSYPFTLLGKLRFPFRHGFQGELSPRELPKIDKALAACSRRCGLDIDTGTSPVLDEAGSQAGTTHLWATDNSRLLEGQSVELDATFNGPSRTKVYVLVYGEKRGFVERVRDWWRSVTRRP